MEALFFIIFLASRFVPGKFNQYGPDLVPIDTVKGRNISNPSLQSRIINPPEPGIQMKNIHGLPKFVGKNL